MGLETRVVGVGITPKLERFVVTEESNKKNGNGNGTNGHNGENGNGNGHAKINRLEPFEGGKVTPERNGNGKRAVFEEGKTVDLEASPAMRMSEIVKKYGTVGFFDQFASLAVIKVHPDGLISPQISHNGAILADGSKVSLLSQISGATQIAFPDGKSIWAHDAAVKDIENGHGPQLDIIFPPRQIAEDKSIFQAVRVTAEGAMLRTLDENTDLEAVGIAKQMPVEDQGWESSYDKVVPRVILKDLDDSAFVWPVEEHHEEIVEFREHDPLKAFDPLTNPHHH